MEVPKENLELALHFTGRMRDYCHQKWKQASGLSDAEIQEVMQSEINPRAWAKEYLDAAGIPYDPEHFKDL